MPREVDELPGTADVPIFKKIEGKKNIPGIFGSFTFFAHGFEYSSEFETTTGLEDFENEMVMGLCRHLILNNVRFEQLQVKCNNKARTKQLVLNFDSDMLRMINVEYADVEVVDISQHRRVTILLLVGNDSEDQEESFAKAILQAMTNSLNGVIVFASFKIIDAAKGENWIRLINCMYRWGYIHPCLRIHCRNHRQMCNDISTLAELEEVSPLGGCLRKCQTKECGHLCGSVCHPYPAEHSEGQFLCRELCRLCCPAGHRCVNLCYEPCRCKGGCKFLRKCGHIQDSKKLCKLRCPGILDCGHKCPNTCFECNKKHQGVVCNLPCDKQCAYGHICLGHLCSTKCPPCQSEVEYNPSCGHNFTLKCCESPDLLCRQPCRRRYPFCGHPCPHLCYEDCELCPEIYTGPHPKCGHIVQVPCGMPIVEPCQKLVNSRLESMCGHEVYVRCGLFAKLTVEETTALCNTKCDPHYTNQPGYCGHECSGNCSACKQERFHIRCNHVCEKLLICGHICKISCPAVCPPCIKGCMAGCEHYRCPFECGLPCAHVCSEPCPYSCEHFSCTKLCGEICDRPGCNEPCPKMLECGHPCCGFCGESCPQACRHCSPEKLIDIVDCSDNETLGYISVPPCGHCVEESALRTWMMTNDSQGEILLKRCPVCLQPIDLTLRLYSKQILEAWGQVNEIKKRIYGDETEIINRLKEVQRNVTLRLQAPLSSSKFFQEYAQVILKECTRPIKIINTSGVKFDSMYMDRVKFIEWAATEWTKSQDLLSVYENTWNQKNVSQYQTLYAEVFRLTMLRTWPLYPNEFNCIQLELMRISDMDRLFNRLSSMLDDRDLFLGNAREGRQRFCEAKDVLVRWEPYTPAVQEEFLERFKEFTAVQNVTLKISEEERIEIVKAFGSRAGRWFKCPNGHVYVVTECGGTTEFGTCNVCGAVIGGENHQLVASNLLATEMDGAQSPMYPTVLQRQ